MSDRLHASLSEYMISGLGLVPWLGEWGGGDDNVLTRGTIHLFAIGRSVADDGLVWRLKTLPGEEGGESLGCGGTKLRVGLDSRLCRTIVKWVLGLGLGGSVFVKRVSGLGLSGSMFVWCCDVL
jgi:hypothetical protein